MSYSSLAVIIVSCVVMLILVYLVILTRQVALLYVRFGPVGARVTDMGPDLGSPLDEAIYSHLQDAQLQLGGRGQGTLLLVVSPSCSICHELMPSVKAFIRHYRHSSGGYNVVLITNKEEEAANQQFVNTHQLNKVPFVASSQLVEQLRISGSPYAVLVDGNGIVRSKGIVNGIEHLESLMSTPANAPTLGLSISRGGVSKYGPPTASGDSSRGV